MAHTYPQWKVKETFLPPKVQPYLTKPVCCHQLFYPGTFDPNGSWRFSLYIYGQVQQSHAASCCQSGAALPPALKTPPGTKEKTRRKKKKGTKEEEGEKNSERGKFHMTKAKKTARAGDVYSVHFQQKNQSISSPESRESSYSKRPPPRYGLVEGTLLAGVLGRLACEIKPPPSFGR